jgi:hypothetical protein
MPNDAMLWTAKPPTPRQPRPGERLWTMRKAESVAHAELRCHGEWGFGWQYFRDGSFLYGRRCVMRSDALACAEEQRQQLERAGWTLERDHV